MKQYVQEYIERHQKQKQKIKELLSNTSYIEWLINFTQKIDYFSDYTWLYNKIGLDEKDYTNIEKIGLFYDCIDRYASCNYLYPTIENNGNSYYIKFNDIGFEIGIIYGQGTIHFCKRIPITNENTYINFKDIINNKEQDNINEIKETLDKLSAMISTSYQKGIPIEAIKNTADKAINEIIWQEKQKVLIKK